MVDAGLKDYIEKQLKAGYSLAQIKATLSQSGYTDSDVSSALGHHSKFVIALLFVVFSVIVVSVIFFIRLDPVVRESPSFTVSLEVLSPKAYAGDILSFTIHLNTPLNSARVKYRIYSSTGDEVASKQEFLSEQTSFRDSITLSHSLLRGSYKLVAEVTSNGKTAITEAPFEIAGKGSPFRIVDAAPEPNPTIESDIKEIADNAINNPGLKTTCLEFADPNDADTCLLESGLSSKNAEFCSPIKNLQRRDSCFFNIIFTSRNTAQCYEISNPSLKSTCEKL